MPVRIYEIAKRVGLENKEVLSKAKELGITAARVPSSTLDKITAEYLEEQIRAYLKTIRPEPVEPPPAPPVEVPPPPAPVAIEPPPAAAPEVKPEPAPEVAPLPTALEAAAPAPPPAADVVPVTPAIVEPVAPAAGVPPSVEAPAVVPVTPEIAVVPPPEPEPPAPPPPPPPPPKPSIGELVGRIELKPRPGAKTAARAAEKPAAGRPLARSESGRGRFDQRAPAGATSFAHRQSAPPSGRAAVAPAKAPPGEAKVALPDDAPVVTIKPPIIVRDLAEKMAKKPHQVIAALMDMNVWATQNQPIDETIAARLCARFGFKFELEKRRREAAQVQAIVKKVELDEEDKIEDMKPRAPVVTIMGHVDHGKTSLLDVIRKSDVAAGEAGGITQHIGAYTISVPHPERKGELQQITFLDTPGHAAFSAMRARGANVTDIVILVVAANDGVMPQTLEALSHAKAANVPIIVAVNKCDHPSANSMKVRQQLQDKGLVPDEWGGNTFFVDCSALTKQGIDKLLEMVCFQADLLELKANPERKAKGNVIESGIEPGGPVATVLVRKGTLRVSDVVLCDQYYGRVRALINEDGHRMKEAGPSNAVKILGLNGVPTAGLEFCVYQNEKLAREEAERRAQEAKQAGLEASGPKVSLENLFATIAKSEAKVLRVVVKADTQGSQEAIVDALNKIDSQKVSLEVVHSAVGTIAENDVLLATASKAIILGFHTRVDSSAAELAKREGVQIKLYTIIYELIDEVKLAMAGMLEPILKEIVTGVAEVRKVFVLSKGGNVAGSMVTTGRIVKGKVRVMRRRNLIYEGHIASLRRFQDEVNEVRAGMECGIRMDGFNEFQTGDTVECFALEKITPQL